MTIFMRCVFKLTDYAIYFIFKLAILLEGLLDGGNFKSPGDAMDHLCDLASRGVDYLCDFLGMTWDEFFDYVILSPEP